MFAMSVEENWSRGRLQRTMSQWIELSRLTRREKYKLVTTRCEQNGDDMFLLSLPPLESTAPMRCQLDFQYGIFRPKYAPK